MIKKIIHSPNLGLLIFRLFIGLSMAFAHGFSKVPPSEQLVGGIAALGFPAPLFFAWCAGLSEFVGGLLIALGIFTQGAAAVLGFTMLVAFAGVHAADPYQVKEIALLYFFSCVLLVFVGPGNLALGRFFHSKK